MDIAFNPADYPTYNIGDKVTIRQWDDMASEFGLNVFGDIKVPKACFTEPMRKYCGKTLTIVRKNHYLSPNSDCYYFGGSTNAGYAWFLLPSCLNNLIPQLSPPLSPLMIC